MKSQLKSKCLCLLLETLCLTILKKGSNFKTSFCITFLIYSHRFKFKSGNLEHPGDIIRNAFVEVLPVKALAQAKRIPGLISSMFPYFHQCINNHYPSLQLSSSTPPSSYCPPFLPAATPSTPSQQLSSSTPPSSYCPPLLPAATALHSSQQLLPSIPPSSYPLHPIPAAILLHPLPAAIPLHPFPAATNPLHPPKAVL